jgi:hypothetical protein
MVLDGVTGPVDAARRPLNVLPFTDGAGSTLATGTSSARKILPTGTGLVTFWSSQPTYLRLGTSTVTAGTADAAFSVYLPGGDITFPIGTATHVAAILASGTGTLVIMGRG